MRKGMLLITVMMFLGMAGVASAVPYTWTDSIDFNPDILIPPTHSYYHDISDGADGFQGLWTGGNDTISSFSLDIGLYDDAAPSESQQLRIVGWHWILPVFDWVTVVTPDGGESAKITYGLETQTISVSNGVNTFDTNFWGAVDLWDDGTLNVKVASDFGDFYLDYSKLTVTGDNGNTAPVPEPSTILLLGCGLLGLGWYGRKQKKA